MNEIGDLPGAVMALSGLLAVAMMDGVARMCGFVIALSGIGLMLLD